MKKKKYFFFPEYLFRQYSRKRGMRFKIIKTLKITQINLEKIILFYKNVV